MNASRSLEFPNRNRAGRLGGYGQLWEGGGGGGRKFRLKNCVDLKQGYYCVKIVRASVNRLARATARDAGCCEETAM
jgi:hypothetical protein